MRENQSNTPLQDHTAFTAFGQFATDRKYTNLTQGGDLMGLDQKGHAVIIGHVLTDEEFIERIKNAPNIGF